MNEAVKALFQELRVSPLFRSGLEEIREKHRPVIPAYKPGQSREEADSLMERIKFESGRKEGFDLIYLLLTGDRNE